MGRALDWQSWVIEQLRKEPGLILLNPRRADFTPDKLDEQIMWELRELEEADIILMWFPARSEAPISLLETGLYMKSGKLILGVEEGYYRKRNLELTAQYYNVPVHLTLDSLIAEIMRQHKLVAA
ncbi:MAG: nucleoside 2-deoxyribosyltransferase domain-containing protein [Anaerolineaceae bacterium]|nr:nucleoside 2-deoxyribosyltransferase domain-containing protein [Anaerolineaceae bacterium]